MAHAKTVLFCKLTLLLFLVSTIYRHFQHISFAAVSSLPDYIDDESSELYTELIKPVPDLQLCLNTGPRWPGGPSFCQKKAFYYGFLLINLGNFKFEGVLFKSHSRHNDRVDVCLTACVDLPGLPPSGYK